MNLGLKAARLRVQMDKANKERKEFARMDSEQMKKLEWAKAERMRWSWWGIEPLYAYRRLGRVSGAVSGGALWLREWYEHIHSEETVKRMAEIGINMAITHFFKGFGLRFEKGEIERTKKLIQLCHNHGIKVFGYTQFRSLYYETFLDEEPKAENWIQRNERGELRTWGGSYYRWAPCINHEEFLDYMKKVIRVGIEETGLDGLHFDNSYAEPCYCTVCQERFRQYLEETNLLSQERFGLYNFKHVRIPPFRRDGSVKDPIYQEWIKFRCKMLGEVWRKLYRFVKRINPEVAVLTNPAFPRGIVNWMNTRSVHPFLMGKGQDLMFAENGNFPRMEDGVMINQIRAYKIGQAAGYGVIPTAWMHTVTRSGLPESAEQVKLSLAEASAFGGVVGTNWALRPREGGREVIVNNEELKKALWRYLNFFKKHEELYLNTAPWANVCILYSFPSLSFDFNTVYPSVVGFEQTLIQNQIPYAIVFSEEIEKVKKFEVLVLADQSCLNDHECQVIQEFVNEGGGVVVTGRSGRYNEDFRNRIKHGLSNILKNEKVIYLPEAPEKVNAGDGYTLRVPLPEKSEDLVQAVEKVSPSGMPAKVSAQQRARARSIGLDIWSLPSGKRAIHLVNYDNVTPIRHVKIEFSSKLIGDCKRTIVYNPDEDEIQLLELQASKEVLSLSIPKIDTYVVAVC